MFPTCLNLIMRNQSGVDKVLLVSLLLISDMLKRVSAVSTIDDDHQANNVVKDIKRVPSLRRN